MDAARRRHRRKMRRISEKAYEAKQRSKDLKGFLAKKAKRKLSWTDRNRESVHLSQSKTREKAKASKKWHCDVCDVSLDSITAVNNHLGTKAHADKVAGKPPPKPSAATLRTRRFNEKMQSNKKYHCGLCNLSFPSPAKLTKHQASKRHLAKQASEASAGASLT